MKFLGLTEGSSCEFDVPYLGLPFMYVLPESHSALLDMYESLSAQ